MTSAPVGHPLPAPSAPSARSRRPAAEPDTQRSTHPAPVPRELPTRSRITRWPRHRRHQSPRRTQPARSHFLPRGTFAGSFRPGSRSPDTPRNRRSTPRLSTPSPPSTHWYAGDSGCPRIAGRFLDSVAGLLSGTGRPSRSRSRRCTGEFSSTSRRGGQQEPGLFRLVAQDLATGAHGLDSACAARSVASAARIAPAVSPRMRCRQNSSSWICTSPGCCRGARLDRRLVAVRVKGHLRLVVGCPYAVWAWTRAPLACAGSPSWMRFGPHRPASLLSR